jgi:hypothetical protein
MDDHTTRALEPQKHDAKRVRNLAIAFFVLKLAVCVGIVEFVFRHSEVSQWVRFLIAWLASFLLGILIDIVVRLTKNRSSLTGTK